MPLNRIPTSMVDGLDAQLADIATTNIKKDFGAKGDGITDDTQALINASQSGTYVQFPKGTYYIKNTLDFNSNTVFDGLGASTIKTDQNITLFKLCYRNKVKGFTIDTSAVTSYTSDIFEVSSGTMQGKNVPGEGFNDIEIKDLFLNLAVNSSLTDGSFLHLWACQTDPSGVTYTNYGFSGVLVENINLINGNIWSFCKNWVYWANNQSTEGYITGVTFRDIVMCVSQYCFFGSRSTADMSNLLFRDAGYVSDNVQWEYSNSNYFAFITSGSKIFKNDRPYDIPNHKTYLLQYRDAGAAQAPSDYGYKIIQDFEYGEVIDRVTLNNPSTNIDVNTFIRSCFASYTNVFNHINNQLTGGLIQTGGYPNWFKVVDFSTTNGTFTASFLINLGYYGWDNLGMTIVTMSVQDSSPTDITKNPNLDVQTTPFIPSSLFPTFNISKEVVTQGTNTFARYRIYMEVTGNYLGAGCYYIGLNPPSDEIYCAPVYIQQLGSAPSETLIQASNNEKSALAFPQRADAPWQKPEPGYTYFDTTTNQFKGYNGTSWVVLG